MWTLIKSCADHGKFICWNSTRRRGWNMSRTCLRTVNYWMRLPNATKTLQSAVKLVKLQQALVHAFCMIAPKLVKDSTHSCPRASREGTGCSIDIWSTRARLKEKHRSGRGYARRRIKETATTGGSRHKNEVGDAHPSSCGSCNPCSSIHPYPPREGVSSSSRPAQKTRRDGAGAQIL